MNPALWLLIWSSQRQQHEATGGPIEPPPVWEIYAAAVNELRLHWRLPDGNELVDAHSVRRYEAQIRQGFYERLVWPPGTTLDQATEWLEMAAHAVELHRRGLL